MAQLQTTIQDHPTNSLGNKINYHITMVRLTLKELKKFTAQMRESVKTTISHELPKCGLYAGVERRKPQVMCGTGNQVLLSHETRIVQL